MLTGMALNCVHVKIILVQVSEVHMRSNKMFLTKSEQALRNPICPEYRH